MSNGKNWKERMSIANYKTEGLNSVYVAAGLVGATLIDRGVEKLVEKFLPSAAPYVSYIKPIVLAASGVTAAVIADDKNQRQKLIGYGVAAAGVLSGVRLIPFVDKLLSGINPLSGSPTNLSEQDISLLSGGEIGAVKMLQTENPPTAGIELPDFETSSDENKTGSQRSERASVEDDELIDLGYATIM